MDPRGDGSDGLVDLSDDPLAGSDRDPAGASAAAARRRLQRRRSAPAVVLCLAAATGVVVGASHLLPQEGGDLGQAHLSTAEVQTVVPGARPAPVRGISRTDPPAVPRPDACHTGTLTGVAVPLSAEYGQWTGPSPTGSTADAELSDTSPTTPVRVYATVDTYASPDQAAAYAGALGASVATCTPASESWHPATMADGEDDGAAALFTGGYADGRWDVTAVVVRDGHAVTVSAEVPEAGSAQGSARAATSVVNLATLAADRAASS